MQAPRSFKFNDFQFMRQIGTGKYGTVYLAIERLSQTQVAIKIIPKEKINDEFKYKQLQREVQIHSRLKHLNICQFYAYFQDTNCVYLVLEYCQKGNLFFQVKILKVQYSSEQIASILAQLVTAVSYLHQRNVMHRDMKLENILIDQQSNIKLTDFGLAIHTTSCRSTFCGTPQYICPQMLKNQTYGPQVDVYCLGIILYELYYVNSPFMGVQEQETLAKIQLGNIEFAETEKYVPASAKQLILLLLNRDKSKRPKAKEILSHEFLLKYLQKSQ